MKVNSRLEVNCRGAYNIQFPFNWNSLECTCTTYKVDSTWVKQVDPTLIVIVFACSTCTYSRVRCLRSLLLISVCERLPFTNSIVQNIHPFHAYGSQKGVGNWQNTAKNVKRQKLTFGDYSEKCTISVNCISFLKGVFLKIHKYIQVLGLNEDIIF